MATDLTPYLNTLIISLGIAVGIVVATFILIKSLALEDSQGEVLNTRFLLTVLGTAILAMFGMGLMLLAILGIQIERDYLTALAGIIGAFITIVGTSYTAYFKDRASEKSNFAHHAEPETYVDTKNGREPSIDTFDRTRKMPLLLTR